MFYARINKIKVFNNREGFLGLFNRKEHEDLRKERKGFGVLCGFFAPFAVNCLNCDFVTGMISLPNKS